MYVCMFVCPLGGLSGFAERFAVVFALVVVRAVSASLFACRVAWSDVDAAHGSTFGARRGATTRRPYARLTALAEGRAHSCVQLYVREARR